MISKTVYQYDAEGYFAGETVSFNGLMPNGCVDVAPPIITGFIPRWNGKAWDQVEDHRGEEGFVDGQPIIIRDYGARPEGWSLEPPELTNDQKIVLLKDQIKQVESNGGRANREINLALIEGNQPPAEAFDRLMAIESEIVPLRAQVQTLSAK